MTGDDLARLARRAAAINDGYAEAYGIDRDAAFFLGKLAEELGELTAAQLRLMGLNRGADAPGEALRRAVEDEAADLLGFLLVYAHWQGIDLQAAFDRKWGAFEIGGRAAPEAAGPGGDPSA